MKMRSIYIVFFMMLFLFSACEKVWEEHYGTYPETVDENLWDMMEKESSISGFLELLKVHQLDTLFQTDIAYTVFLPTNDALQQFDQSLIDTTLLKYHLVNHFIQSESISQSRKVMTLSRKYALFQRTANELKLDGILLNYESPLYRNGKFFIMDQVAQPLPNLYEFFAKNNAVVKLYIDSQDSSVLDLSRSKPIGFNEEGNTVFDSVNVVYNLFEEEYFPVRDEFRNKTATIVFPLADDYNAALTFMAQNMGSGYTDYRDIPSIWQQEVLVPYLLEKGVFENMLEPEDFVVSTETNLLKMKNILGDSVVVTYIPTGKSICSNGYAYNYSNFVIPDSLYNKGTKFELETLLEETGINRYAWGEEAKVYSDEVMVPFKEYIATASNDSILRVLFPLGYEGSYSLEFMSQNLFPRRYVMVVRTHMDIGGIYDIYVNDELVKTFDYYDFIRFRGIMPSVTGGRYVPVGRFNSFDFYVDNIHEFSKAKIRFEYKGPGRASSNGLVLDYVEFIPVVN